MSTGTGSGCFLQAGLIIVAMIAWNAIESGDGGAFAVITLIVIFCIFIIGLIASGGGNGPGGSERAYDGDVGE